MKSQIRIAASQPTQTAIIPAGGILQRKCACGGTPGPSGECEACRKKRMNLQRRAAPQPSTFNPQLSEVPPIVHEVLRSPGQPLGVTTRTFMETRFGHDFSQVRVHTDARATESAQVVNALAYTTAPDVVFGAGQYAPRTEHGRLLLAHELTHVLQQEGTGAGVLSGGSLAVEQPGDPHEIEANRIADRVVSGEAASAATGTVMGRVIQRQERQGAETQGPGNPMAVAGSQAQSRCLSLPNINQGRDPLPPYPAFTPIELPVPRIRQKAIETGQKNVPAVVLGSTQPQVDVSKIPELTIRALPVPDSPCKQCVAEWSVPRPPITSFIAGDTPRPQIPASFATAVSVFTLPEQALFGIQKDSECPGTPGRIEQKEVREIIFEDAQRKISFGEFEHWADYQYAFDLIGGRLMANVRRLTPERSPLRGEDEDECGGEVRLFLGRLLGFPPNQILIGYRPTFLSLYLQAISYSGRRDVSDHRAEPEPKPSQKAYPPSPYRNPFGCEAFWRKLTADSLPGVPGPSSLEIIPDNLAPKHPWHET